jgi:hypothetical protein
LVIDVDSFLLKSGTENGRDRKTEYFCLFVCLELYEKFVSYLAAVTIMYSAKHRSKFAALAPVMVTAARYM